jgi:hypothetical protein
MLELSAQQQLHAELQQARAQGWEVADAQIIGVRDSTSQQLAIRVPVSMLISALKMLKERWQSQEQLGWPPQGHSSEQWAGIS